MIPLSWWAVAAVSAAAVMLPTRWYYRAQLADVRDECRVQIAEYEADVERVNADLAKAAHRYEEWKARQEPKVRVVTKEVVRVVQSYPEWGGNRLPDGVRQLADSAPSDIGASEPQPAVPAVRGAAPERDQR